MRTLSSTYRLLALTLAFLMFFTSVGFSVDVHYCQGQWKSFSLLGEAKNCHDQAKANPTCQHHQQMMQQAEKKSSSIAKKDCCHNQTFHLQLDQDQQIQQADFTLHQGLQQFILAYVQVFFQDTFTENEAQAFAHYKPPLIPRDIPVLTQSFLL